MWRRAVVLGVTAAIVVAAGWVGQAISEEPRGGDRPPRDPDQMRERFEEFRRQMSDRQREALGASEEEWKVLQPMIEKVQTLSRESRGGMFGGMARGRGGPGGAPGGERRPGGEADRPPSEAEAAAEGLRKVLDDKEAKPDQIKAALTALRDARAKSRAQLETAQKALREVVTLRQEAVLVTMGVLE